MNVDRNRPEQPDRAKGSAGPPTESYRPLSEGPGAKIGPYKLLQQIGEGGFGIVYLAEQDQPVHRRVALKVIKPGMDSAQVIARFEAERQALAMMDHQNIAKVYDAGTSGGGRPFFVMELVRGVPLTKYCDDSHLHLVFNGDCQMRSLSRRSRRGPRLDRYRYQPGRLLPQKR
jgi:serine/threonine protein kinase